MSRIAMHVRRYVMTTWTFSTLNHLHAQHLVTWLHVQQIFLLRPCCHAALLWVAMNDSKALAIERDHVPTWLSGNFFLSPWELHPWQHASCISYTCWKDQSYKLFHTCCWVCDRRRIPIDDSMWSQLKLQHSAPASTVDVCRPDHDSLWCWCWSWWALDVLMMCQLRRHCSRLHHLTTQYHESRSLHHVNRRHLRWCR